MTDHSASSLHLTAADWAILGTAGLAAGIILSPFVLPVIGIGSHEVAAEIMAAMHGTGTGNGLAGALGSIVNAVPAIGPTLAQGGLASAFATAAIGLGGTTLGRHLAAGDTDRPIAWGAILTTAALATSALIALPSILTGLSVGLAFLADTIGGVALANQAITFLSHTLGSTGSLNAATATTSLGALLPHLLTCGATLLPLSGVWAAHHVGKVEEKELGIEH